MHHLHHAHCVTLCGRRVSAHCCAPAPTCTKKYITLPLLSTQPTLCFIQFTSSRSEKSSRACAPRDSLRASALYLFVCLFVCARARSNSHVISCTPARGLHTCLQHRKDTLPGKGRTCVWDKARLQKGVAAGHIHCDESVVHNVLQLQRLEKIRVPD
jgi:hypothetical protein